MSEWHTPSADDSREIRELNARYAFGFDEVDGLAWAATFTADGIFHSLVPGERPRGRAQLQEFVPKAVAEFGRMHHLPVSEVIEVSGDTARQKAYLLFFAEHEGRVQGFVARYDDELVKEGGRWRFTERRVRLELKYADTELMPLG